MTIQDTLPWKRSAVGVAVIGGLALLLVAACASAFSMLIWEPAADPVAAAAPAVVSGRSGRVQPGEVRRVEKFGESRMHRSGLPGSAPVNPAPGAN